MLRGRYKGLEPLDRGGVDGGVVQAVPVSCCLDKKQNKNNNKKPVPQLVCATAWNYVSPIVIVTAWNYVSPIVIVTAWNYVSPIVIVTACDSVELRKPYRNCNSVDLVRQRGIT